MQYQGALLTRILRVVLTLARSAGTSTRFPTLRRMRLLASALPLTMFAVGVAYAANVQYIYDPAGRLTGVIDQNGNAAEYVYDASGNITSILRPAAGSINVLGFSPALGPVSANITITGTGFSATASQDTVKFNGTAATVVSATTTQIVATVPTGATTGTISVTSPTGTATSIQSFTVTPPSAAAPSISGFTPTSGGYGDTVTISGSGFATSTSQETVSFSGADGIVTATSATSITVTVPAGGATGPITVATQSGSATSAASFYVIPGGYTSTNTGAITSVSAYGQSATVTASNTNDGYIVKFTGTAGDRVSVNVLDSGSNMTLANAEVFDPNGSVLFGPVGTQTITAGNPYNPGFLMGPFVLPVTGTYSVVIAPQNGSTGSAQVSVYKVLPDQTGTLVSATAQAITLQTPGQNAIFTFSANANDRAMLLLGGPTQTYTEGLFEIFNPDGTVLNATTSMEPISTATFYNAFNGPFILPQTGTYKVVLDLYQSYLFSGTLSFLHFPGPGAPNITLGGPAVTTPTISNPQPTFMFFSGTAGQTASFATSNNTVGYISVSLYNADGTQNGSINTFVNSSFVGNFSLNQTGTYALVLSPALSGNSGTTSLTAYKVPADPTTLITLGGGTATESATVPGEGVAFTFAGTSGQRASFNFTNNTLGNALAVITNPDGTTLASPQLIGGNNFIGPFSLLQTGTYKIVITPNSSSVGGTGSITIQGYSVPPDPSGTLVVNGAGLTETTTVPGQGVDFLFSGTTGQQIHFNYSNDTIGYLTFTVYNPNGSQLGSTSVPPSSGSTSSFTLTATGTQKVVITTDNPLSGPNTGSVTVSVLSP